MVKFLLWTKKEGSPLGRDFKFHGIAKSKSEREEIRAKLKKKGFRLKSTKRR